MTIFILVSASEEDAERLAAGGPRRDFLALAEHVDGRIRYRTGPTKARGWRGRLLGPHLRQAWSAAREARPGDRVLADGEHIGLPLAIFLGLRRKRSVRVVMIGHLLSRRWKIAALRLANVLHPNAVLVTHGIVQQRLAQKHARRWRVALLPYLVDNDFWHSAGRAERERPMVVAAGSENRDYETLIAAARGASFDVTIAAGSHWARDMATARDCPPNVTIRSSILGFAELRELYSTASVVVVPLVDVPNQSGVTSILEGIAMSRPVVASAARGQREVIAGPLVQANGEFVDFQRPRGPAHFGFDESGLAPNGLYVRPGDSAALRAAIERLLADRELAAQLARNGRETVQRCFTVEGFVQSFSVLLVEGEPR